jgi:segregation and condensation protein B
MTMDNDEQMDDAESRGPAGDRPDAMPQADPEACLKDQATEDPVDPPAPAPPVEAPAVAPDIQAFDAGEVMTVDAVLDSTSSPGIATALNEQLVVIIEAIVFASPEPITFKAILKLLDAEPKEQVQAALAELKRRYEDRPGGLQFVEVANGYQIVTRPELHEWVRRMFHERTTQKLSVQALETLAVVAYKQPITAAEITEIRGVNTSGVIGTLLERGLVKISGRKQVVGRPFLYSTTREFLDRFGLRDLNDLPKVEDMAGALGFEVPAGIATEVPQLLPTDEPATPEDVAVMTGEGEGGDGDTVDG